jgi:hypothetical protein
LELPAGSKSCEVAFLLGVALGIITLEFATEDAVRDIWLFAPHVDGSARGNDGAVRDLNEILSRGEANLPPGRGVLDLVSRAVGKLNIVHALGGIALKLSTDIVAFVLSFCKEIQSNRIFQEETICLLDLMVDAVVPAKAGVSVHKIGQQCE